MGKNSKKRSGQRAATHHAKQCRQDTNLNKNTDSTTEQSMSQNGNGSSNHHSTHIDSFTVESNTPETVEYFDVATPDASTLKSVISLVAREESISLQDSPERDSADCNGHYCQNSEQSPSSSLVTETLHISTPATGRDVTDMGTATRPGGGSHADVIVSSETAANTTAPSVDIADKFSTTPSTDKAPIRASSGAQRQTLPELLMSVGCFLALFPILQLQLLLVAHFPNDVSTVSALTPPQPATSPTSHDLATVRVEFMTLCRLAWSIAINQVVEAPVVKAAMGLPDASTRGWKGALCRLLYLCFLPVRVMCRALLVPLCMTMLPAGQHTQVAA